MNKLMKGNSLRLKFNLRELLCLHDSCLASAKECLLEAKQKGEKAYERTN